MWIINRFWILGFQQVLGCGFGAREHSGVQAPAATLDDVRAAVAAGADLDLRCLFEGSGLWVLGLGFRVQGLGFRV